ncbi:hypothetical protein [Brachybacterium hainanense]|uniref:DUF5667 domain-containing protein n=1 Tax=Brachybacterium hainanense TaxID=1541174 RepID=A0ABV6RBZ5_9MICO
MTDLEHRPLAQEEPRRPQDFGLDVGRLRRIRLICFAILAVPLLLLGLLAMKFVSMPLTQAWQDSAYGKQQYQVAVERLAPVWVVNWFEPYLPHLTKGTNLLQQGEDAAAEAELRLALEEWQSSSDLNQPMHAQCKILNNLAISIERQAVLIEDPAERADRLFEAEEMLYVCASGGGGGEGEGQGGGGEGEGSGGSGTGNEDQETTDGNHERVEEERRKADEEAGNDPDAREKGGQEGGQEGQGSPPDPGSPKHEDPEGTGDPEEATTQGETSGNPKEDELEERNREANQGDGESSDPGTPQDPERPW